ncbi:hypothetical protein GCM10027429_07080 [Marivirga atlantica]|jgi:hypothetical protein|uniref:Glycosyl transferases group 1 n=1 Tax=Marivirga atlantica TaxID=1548457 RepID=A0A937ADM0_9BACT|nr:hypothetical protein [Marivirga atlantica]MBL0764318.1 hypothetical protein [Marivirga atlantica]
MLHTEYIKDKIILIISPQKWSEVKVSKHYYAIELTSLGNTVYFLNPPTPKLKDIKISATEYESIKCIDYGGFISGIGYLPKFLRNKIFRKKLLQFEKLIVRKINIVWSFDNSVFYDFSALPSRIIKISHIVDFNQHFNIELSSRTADICLGSTRHIVKRSERFNKNSYFIHHGYLPSSNEKTVAGNKKEINLNLPGNNKIKAGYAGNLDIKYIDWSLLEHLVNEFQNIDFVFAGPWEDEKRKKFMESKANFFYIGKLPSNRLTNFYMLTDILIITYRYQEFPEQLANPHKMMGYLGSGKMIISTWSEEYSELNEERLILMAQDKDIYTQYFGNVIDNMNLWSSNELTNRRKEYALNNTYSNQIKRVEKLIYT